MVNVVKITPDLHYNGKILKQGHKYYTGAFFKMLKSGKNLCLDYKDGLLRKAVISNGKTVIRTYDYDINKKLTNVSKNGEDIFTKTIKNKIGVDFYRTEIINDNIYKVYNQDNQLIANKILPKSIASDFSRIYEPKHKLDIVKETRFYISNLIFKNGGYYLRPDGPDEPVYVYFKTIFKELANKYKCVIEKKDNKEITTYKDSDGKILAQSDALFDKNDKPVWEKITGKSGLSVDLKYFNSERVKSRRIVGIIDTQKSKSVLDREYDTHGNIIFERKIQRSQNGDIKQINVFERKFDDNDLMIEEKKYKETDSGKKLIYTSKKEYNTGKLPVKEDYYNAKNELETSEHRVYDKRGKLMVLRTKEYGEYPESGYTVFDKNGVIRKKSTLNESEGSITEEYFDKNSLFIKKIIKNENGCIFSKYEFLYDADKKNRIKTIKKDNNNNVELTIDYYKDKDSNKEIKVYKDSDGKLIGKEFIKQDEDGYKYYYTNSKGKRCDFVELLIAVHGDMGI